MIAAGEVVQRPASVVKELMENAIDAGATQVSVFVTDAGRTLIQVIDNGCGMSSSDAVLCFERHATSKIAAAEDLDRILTYGFRGEALASIAAVADVTLKTRREGDETGTQVHIEGGGPVKTSSVATPVGSNFSVRNLFYNTPARRKFLKSDNVEQRHIIEEFTRVAMTRPDTAFSLTCNGRELFVLKKAMSLKFRIQDLLGLPVASELVDLSVETQFMSIDGFVGKPQSARKATGNQFFFINGRYFRSAYLHKAVMKAYEQLIPEGVTPSYVLFMRTEPEEVDVNIHPTKAEVKFGDDSMVFQLVNAAVRETLGRNSFGPDIDFDTEGAVELPVIGKNYDQYAAISAPNLSFDPDYDPFSTQTGNSGKGEGSFASRTGSVEGSASEPDYRSYVAPRDDYGKLFEDNPSSNGRMLLLGGKYILTPAASGLMLVHIRRARERVLYEQNMRALDGQVHVSQSVLFPVDVYVGASQLPLFEEYASMLRNLGFELKLESADSVTVYGVPEGYSCEGGKVEELVRDIVAILAEEMTGLPEILQQRIAGKMAVAGSSGGESDMVPAEASRLIDTLFACGSPEFSPRGKKILSLITFDDIDKLF